MRLRIAGLWLLLAGMTPSAHGLRTVLPIHFFVVDTFIRATPLARWNDNLLPLVAAADRLLCEEIKKAEKVSGCDLSFQGAIKVTP